MPTNHKNQAVWVIGYKRSMLGRCIRQTDEGYEVRVPGIGRMIVHSLARLIWVSPGERWDQLANKLLVSKGA